MDREFSLCDACSERQTDEAAFRKVSSRDCFICRGLLLRLPKVERRILRRTHPYQFKTFSVGLIVPADVQEREDELRSELKVKGMETIKSQTSRSLVAFIEKKTRKKVDRRNPELTVLVDLNDDDIFVTAKSLFIHARYTKPIGVSQKMELCEKCSGRGCGECKDGYADLPSMEQILGRRLGRILGAAKSKFTWIGSEDVDSIVYPPGRPFVVEMKSPRRRRLPSRFGVTTGNGKAEVTGVRVLEGRPVAAPAFVFKTLALIETAEKLDGVDFSAAKRMTGAVVRYRNNKGKDVVKKVYSVKIERDGRRVTAEIKLDGGLPVKRLISGESVSPSLSETLGVQLVCKKFDILRVWESEQTRLPQRA